MINRKLFGERLKNIRIERGLTITKLAKELKVSAAVLSKYERGLVLPKATFLLKLAIFFDVSSDYLLGLSDS